MRAVVKTGGKQYVVATGDKITIEKIEGQAGDTVALESLLTGDAFGAGNVQVEIVEHIRSNKILVFKKKRRQNYRRKNGHRQELTVVKVTSISA